MEKLKLFVFIILVYACSPQPVGDQKKIAEEIENREIKRVTKAQILEEASKKGEMLAATAQKTLAATLTAEIEKGGIIAAIEHCNILAQPLMDSLSSANGATIRRVSKKVRNPTDKPDPVELDILDAYEYAKENSLDLKSNVQELDDQTILFTKPILLANPLCLNCHGITGEDILKENHQAIQTLYPEDSATGYSIGDLRGMWSIRFQKKELIGNMQ